MVIKSISSSKCSRVRSTLGSRNSAKYFRGLSIPPSHPTQPNSHIAIKMRLPCVPNRIGAAPVATFERVCIGVAQRPNENPICEFWWHALSASIQVRKELASKNFKCHAQTGLRARMVSDPFQDRNQLGHLLRVEQSLDPSGTEIDERSLVEP